MMEQIPDRSLMVFEFLRERKCLTDKPGNTLAKGIVEALDGTGFACLFTDSPVALGR